MATSVSNPSPRTMELEGSLAAFSVPEILQFLSLGKMTGVLSFHRGDYWLELGIAKGKLVGTRASRHSQRIGVMLVCRGLISLAALEEALESQQAVEAGKKIGQILVERGLLDPGQLEGCLLVQIEEEVWDLFRWGEGQFKFDNKPEDQIQRDPAMELDIEALVMEGTRRQDEWELIERTLTSEDLVLTAALPPPLPAEKASEPTAPAAEAPEAQPVAAAAAPSVKTPPRPKLAPEEWKVLAAIDGFSPVGALAERCGIGKFETYHALYALLETGYLAIKGDLAAGQAPAPDFHGRKLDGAPGPEWPAPERDRAAAPTLLGRLWALFSGGSSSSERPRTRTFETPISLFAAFVSDLIVRYARTREFGAGAQERDFLVAQWQRILTRHPAADLIRATGFRLDASMFDGYVRMAKGAGEGARETTAQRTGENKNEAPDEEADESLRDCYEETIEALRLYLKRVYDVACQRLGARTARRMAEGLLSEYREATVARSTLFDLSEAVRPIVEEE